MPRRAPERELTACLWLREEEDRATVLVERPDGLQPLAHVVFEARRARIMLVMLGGRRLLDVTVQPGAIARVVASEAVASRRDGNAWCSAIEAAVARTAHERGLWRRSDIAPRGLVPLLTGLAFPILASVYDLGTRPVAEVPRWGEHVLAQPSAREAAAAAFGPRSTRRTTRALASSLVPNADAPDDATVALGPLCLALIGRSALEPDQLADVLAAPPTWHAPPVWLSLARLESSALILGSLGPIAGTRLLLDAAARPRGIEVLLDTLDLYRYLRHHFPTVPPARLDALRSACLELAPCPMETVAAAEAQHRRTERRRREAPRLSAHAAPVDDHAPLRDRSDGDPTTAHHNIFAARNAPQTRNVRLPAAYRYPAILRELEHVAEGDIRLLLPHTPSELASWGRRLSNCLALYARAVATGASWVVGVERATVLTACVEIDPAERSVRQFLAAHNRPPSAALVEATLHVLVTRGVVRAVERV